MDKFAAKISRDLAPKYHLNFFGIGGGGTKDGISLDNVRFCFNGKPLDELEGRKLIIAVSEEFLSKFNENPEIRPLLNAHPFTAENINIGIFLNDFDGNYIFDPYLDIVSVSDGKVGYYTRNPNDIYKFKSEIYDIYSEALENVKFIVH